MDPAPDPQPNPQPDSQPVQAPATANNGEKNEKYDGFYKPWDRFTKKKPLTSVTPSLDVDAEGRPSHLNVRRNTEGVVSRLNATTSFDEAKANCEAKVAAIVRECRRLNQKYYDRLFDLPDSDTLLSLNGTTPMSMNGLQGIGGVKRVEDIYDDPQFFVDGAAANDVRQGIVGDCWFIAAITALSGKPELLERLCVARDEGVGVYGFVFFRDGEWISEVVDDRLALKQSDDNTNYMTEYLLKTYGDKDPMKTKLEEMSYGIWRLPKEFRESLRKGSNALYFASCRDSNETWLPLMEKAYAKAHGDYQSIEGGFAGEGIEDLTGGVATYIKSEDVLDKEQLWQELMQVNDKFLFGCGSRRGRDNDPADEEGFVRGHAYTVLEAREIDKPKSLIEMEEKEAAKKETKKKKKGDNGKVRLLKLHNPWGKQEWNGAWSDGAKEWTPEVLEKLNHTFGDDGLFWISYQDFLRYYPEIDRIRLFGNDWTVAQQWTAVNVPWTAEYLDTSFKVTITKEGPVVLVLSQPDDRYFQGLIGRYSYDLHFRLYKEGEDVYLLRSMEDSGSNRSVKAEVDLEPGVYHVLVKLTATRSTAQTPQEVIKQYRDSRREKLLAIGKSFDLTHSKGKLREREQENEKKEKKTQQEKDHKKLVEERDQNRKERLRNRLRARRVKAEEKRKKDVKMAAKKAELQAKKEAKEAEKKRKQAEKEAEETKAKDDAKDSEKDKEANTTAGAEKSSSDEKPAETQDASSNSTSSVGQPTPSTEKSSEDAESKAKEDTTVGKDDEKKTKDEGTSTEDDKKAEDGDSKEGKKDDADKKEDEEKKKDDDAKDGDGDKEEECESEEDPEISDVSSVEDDDFEWDNTMDGPQDDDEDESDDSDSEDDMYADDPWDATCVIGLRVCSMDKEASIKVVHARTKVLNRTSYQSHDGDELIEKRKVRYPLYKAL